MVTASRVRSSAKSRAADARKAEESATVARGGWNACTVDDPAHDIDACGGLTGSSAPGPAGRATTLVGEGITKAWRGDVDAAIAAFDRAIAIAPNLAPAYLNRGLSYARKGDDARALADLDQAIRHAPNDPRGYRGRSQILLQRGEGRQAEADKRRAENLDRR